MEPCRGDTNSNPINSTALCVEIDRPRTDASSGHIYSFHPEWTCNGTKHSWRILLFASGLALKTVPIQSQFLYTFYNVFDATSSFLTFSMHAIASGL
jgi:hypothetical protein